MTKSGLRMVALVRGSERFVWIFNDSHLPELFRSFCDFAENPQLRFTAYDAGLLAMKVRQERDYAEMENGQ